MPSGTGSGSKGRSVLPNERIDQFDAYFFVVTPSCLRPNNGCTAEHWGVKNMGGTPSFLPEIRGSHPTRNLGRLLHDNAAKVDAFDADKFLSVNYEMPEVQAELTQNCLPLGRVFLYCPPCLSSVTTARAICAEKSNSVVRFLIRVDHRLRCSCAAGDEPSLKRIENLLDTISDVESGFHWAKPGDVETRWMDYLDRDWMDRQVYEAEGNVQPGHEINARDADNSYFADMRGVLKRGVDRGVGFDRAVVLGDAASLGRIMNAQPFKQSTRPLLSGQVFLVGRERGGNGWATRQLLGTYTTRDARKRRVADSPRLQPIVPAKRPANSDSESGNLSDVE